MSVGLQNEMCDKCAFIFEVKVKLRNALAYILGGGYLQMVFISNATLPEIQSGNKTISFLLIFKFQRML